MSPPAYKKSRQFGYLLFWMLGVWALASVILNVSLRQIEQRIPQIEGLVAKKSEFNLDVSELDAYWTGLELILEANSVSLMPKADPENKIILEHASVELDLIESIFTFSPRVKKVFVKGLLLEVIKDQQSGQYVVKGFPSKTEDRDTKELVVRLLDQFVFTTEQIYLDNIRIKLFVSEQESFDIQFQKLLLDNEWFNHQLNAKLKVIDTTGYERFLSLHSLFQGNPLVLDEFSSRFYLDFQESEWGYWLKKIKLPDAYPIKFQEGNFGAEIWGEIKKGHFEKITISTHLEKFAFSNLEKSFIEHIERLDFVINLESSINLSKLNNRKYILQEIQNNLLMRVGNFSLEWGDFFYQDILFLANFQKQNEILEPLKEKWLNLESNDNEKDKILIRLLLNRFPMQFVERVRPSAEIFFPEYSKKIQVPDDLRLQGEIENIQIFVYQDKHLDRKIYASANAKNIGVSAFNKVPGIKGIDAYVEYAPGVIGIELDTSNILLEESYYLFRDDLIIKKANGYVLVEFLPNDIVVHSDFVSFQSDVLKGYARFAANAPNRFYEDGEKEIPSWSLRLVLDPVPVNEAEMFFLGKLPPDFLDWVDRFLLEGDVGGDLMVFAFAKKKLPHTYVTLTADLSLQNATLDPIPKSWPEINDVNASVQVYNDRVWADVPTAKLFDSNLRNGKVSIPSYLNQNLPRVEIHGDVSGNLEDVQKLFLNSELKENLGHVIEDWVLVGDHQTHVYMNLPLAPIEGQKPSEININMSVEDILLAVPSVGLGVKGLKSELNYSLSEGLQSDEVSASLFDKPISGAISSINIGDEQLIQITGKGRVSADDLRAWQEYWLFDVLQGETDFDASILIATPEIINRHTPELKEIPMPISDDEKQTDFSNTSKVSDDESIVRLDVKTSFNGLAIDLPGDYAKTAQQNATSQLQLDIYPDFLSYRLNYANEVGVSARTVNDEFDRAHILFGAGEYTLPDIEGLKVSGAIYTMNFDEWLAYLEEHLIDDADSNDVRALEKSINSEDDDIFDDSSFLDLLAAKEGSTNSEAVEPDKQAPITETDELDFVKDITIFIHEFIGFGQKVDQVNAKVTRDAHKWKIVLDSELSKGEIWVPDAEDIDRDNPIVAKLSHLNLDYLQTAKTNENKQTSKSDESGASGTPVEDQVSENSANQITTDDNQDFVPDDFVDIKVDIKRVVLNKTKYSNWRFEFYPDEDGMDFKVHQLNYGLMTINGEGRWTYSEDKSVTHFNGRVRTSAMSSIFGALNLKPSSDSGGLMAVKISWPGSPMDFDPDKMKGKAGLRIFDGSIVEVDIKSKKFKALGIFNLGFITDIVTLRVFKKIGKGLGDALKTVDKSEHEKEDQK